MADPPGPAFGPEFTQEAEGAGGRVSTPSVEGDPATAVVSVPEAEPATGRSSQGKAFVSYSRHDREFVRWLEGALATHGWDTWIDWHDIQPTARWREEIRRAVRATGAFIFVITPQSAGSSECTGEVDHAVEDGKRLAPLLLRDVDAALLPDAIAACQWIDVREGVDRSKAIDALVEALGRDPEWVQEHTRLLVRAADWERAKLDRSFLLRGNELEEAERWLEGAARERDPQPTPLHTRYIVASRRDATRGQRRRFAAVAVALAVSLVLSAVAVIERNTARQQQRIARSRELSANAVAQLGADPELGLLIAIQAMRASSPPTAQAELALREALLESRVLHRLDGITFPVEDAAYSPDGSEIAAVGGAGDVVLNRSSGPRIRAYDGHTDRVSAVAFDATGDRFITASDDGTARVWDPGADRSTAVIRPTARDGSTVRVLDAALSRDGTLAVEGDTRGAAIWDARSAALVSRLEVGKGRILAVAVSQGVAGGIPAVATVNEGVVQLWSLQDGSHLLDLPGNDATSVAFGPDGTQLITGGVDGTARVWDGRSGDPIKVLRGHAGPIASVAFGRDGTRAVTAGVDGTARVWEIQSGRSLFVLRGHTATVTAAAFDPSGKEVMTAGRDRSVRIWDVESGQPSVVLQNSGFPVTGLAVGRDGREVVAAGEAAVTAWSVGNPPGHGVTGAVGSGPVRDVAVSPADGQVAVIDDAGTLGFWTVGSPEVRHDPHGWKGLLAVAYSSDGRWMVAAGSKGEMWRVDRTTGAVSEPPTRRRIDVTSVALSHDGRFVAMAGRDGSVGVWDTTANRIQAIGDRSGRIQDLAFGPSGDDEMASAGTDQTAVIWGRDPARTIATLHGHTGRVNAVAFGPGGSQVATGGDDGIVRVWSARGAWLDLISPHAGAITALTYLPSGEVVVATSTGLVAKYRCGLCLPAGEDLLTLAGHRVTRPLTCAEVVDFIDPERVCVATSPSQSPTPSAPASSPR